MDTIAIENNFPPDFLSQSHLDSFTGYMELEGQKDQAVLNDFLLERERLSFPWLGV
jgi:hypothetical protein